MNDDNQKTVKPFLIPVCLFWTLQRMNLLFKGLTHHELTEKRNKMLRRFLQEMAACQYRYSKSGFEFEHC